MAVERFEEVTSLAPKWSIGHAALSIGLMRQLKYEEALAATYEAQRLDPKWPGAIAAGARVLVNANRFDDAIQEYRRAMAMDKNNPNLMAELSLVYHATHLNSEAMRYAKMALEIDEDLVAPRILLAERALEEGDSDTARLEAGRAVATSPRSLSAHLAYADALALNKDKVAATVAYRKVLTLHDARADSDSEHANRIKLVRKALARKRLPPTRTDVFKSRSKKRNQKPDRSKTEASPMAKPPRRERAADRNDPISDR